MLKGYDRDSYAERALAFLEKDICYLAHMNWGYGMDKEDVAQELRMHLWNKLHLYHPGKAGLRTWAQRVMRMKLIDMSQGPKRSRREILDSDRRAFIENDEQLYTMINGTGSSTNWVVLFGQFPVD